MKRWHLYILACADGTFYTGITTDLARRIAAHEAGTGARYTRGRGPLRLVYAEECPDQSAALRRERAVKALGHAEKAALAKENGP